MPESAQDYYDRILAATDADGRLPVAVEEMPGWDIFPYEVGSLRLKRMQPLLEREPARQGEDPATCRCVQGRAAEGVIWSNERWRISVERSGLPITAVLVSHEHHDLADLPEALASEFGQLLVVAAAAIEALPSVGRAHVARYGDGGAHLHVFLFGRPARAGQFRGSPLLDWEENLPKLPDAVAEENAAFVAQRIVAAYGGRAHTPAEAGAPDR
jgi:hypothetical protein